ncbi:MAG: hypothetical protein U9N40_04990 [Euryarchaeota archaeon]|nr:hypothetical protein [Euryarchaeota archaeon]
MVSPPHIVSMRRVYCQFPQKTDLDFTIERPFFDVVSVISGMSGTHATNRVGEDLVKIDILVYVADLKTKLVPVESLPGFSDTLTEMVDFRIILNETILRGDRKIPRSENSFLLRVTETGMECLCSISKEGGRGVLDAMNLKMLITGAVR